MNTLFTDDTIQVAAIRLDAEPEEVDVSLTLLSDTERQKAARFFFYRDRRRFTIARAWLRQLLATRLGTSPESIEFTYRTNGKPLLAGRFGGSGLCFNLSHSEDVAACALSYGREIGIDIETVRIIPGADDIAMRFFSPCENEAYRGLDSYERPLGFLNCWTRKEAFIKALGDGLSYPLDRFDVSLAPGEPARILRVENTPGDACGWTLHGFLPGPGLIGALAVRAFDSPQMQRANAARG